MCGHVGVYGKLPSLNNKTLMAFLLLLDSTRGTDGTGIYSKGEVNKVVGNVFNLLESRQWEKDVHEAPLMLGHNRQSSSGKNSTRNSHPFRFGKIVGAHNGTLSKYLLKDNAQFDVDSECLYYNIEKRGIKETAKDMQGSWSLVWYNEDEEVLRFLRNKERPMVIAEVSEKKINATTKEETVHKAIIWASEEWMLDAASMKYNISMDKMYSTDENMLYEWMLDKGSPILMNKEEITGRSPLPVSNNKKYLNADEEYYSAYGYSRYKGKYKRYKPAGTGKKGKYRCDFCGYEYDNPIDIEYAYPVYVSGEKKMMYVCKDCMRADTYSYPY